MDVGSKAEEGVQEGSRFPALTFTEAILKTIWTISCNPMHNPILEMSWTLHSEITKLGIEEEEEEVYTKH